MDIPHYIDGAVDQRVLSLCESTRSLVLGTSTAPWRATALLFLLCPALLCPSLYILLFVPIRKSFYMPVIVVVPRYNQVLWRL